MTQLAQTVDPAPLLLAQIGDYRAIPIAAIRIGPRLRYLRPDAVSNLANNIAEHGLHVAISVAEEAADDGTKKFLLIDGAHRLEACKQIGWKQVPARVYRLDEIERQILEIDVNLCREELTERTRARGTSLEAEGAVRAAPSRDAAAPRGCHGCECGNGKR